MKLFASDLHARRDSSTTLARMPGPAWPAENSHTPSSANNEQVSAAPAHNAVREADTGADLAKKKTFCTGFYACRPPGMKHGPYEIPRGCVTFEIRYYK
jgi:hypothetical protein